MISPPRFRGKLTALLETALPVLADQQWKLEARSTAMDGARDVVVMS